MQGKILGHFLWEHFSLLLVDSIIPTAVLLLDFPLAKLS